MIYLGLGTNLGDRKKNLDHALELLQAQRVEVVKVSQIWETPPWGILDQDSFLNIAVAVRFEGVAEELLEICLQTELNMGRVRTQKWGPRLIDIDILDFNGQQIQTERLHLPHPFLHKRAFVLLPLADIAPEWIPTGQSETVAELIKNLPEEDLKGMLIRG